MKLLFQKYTFVLLSIFAGSWCFAQKKSLVVAEYDDNAAVNHLQNIVCYTFENGVMTNKDVVLSVPTQKKDQKGDYIRFDIGKNKLYRNRYIITGIGNIIDLKNKKVILAEKDEFVGFNGDSVIFHTNDIFKGNYYSVFSLKNEKYQKVENANYNPQPRPDVGVDESTQPFTINAYAASGKKEVLVKDAGYGESQPLIGDNVKRKFAIFWLDNTSFLYANFSKDQHALSIYKVGTDKSSEKIADIDAVPSTAANAYFEYDADGNIIYTCGKGRFLVDVKKKKADPVVYETLGNNFFVESVENNKYGRTMKYESAEIGKKWWRFDNAQTTKGYAALQTDMVIGTERYAQGVSVWNSVSKKWVLLDISSIANIIGWIEQ
ncbi:MAG: hypothetical protein JWP12_921 [Bacteroidetes bacterium]|nr:hypothetical protein [Bacteroidota bacterium]